MLIRANASQIPLRDGCVQTCVTSPPYWGLRDYGTGSWDGGDPDCDHKGAPQQSQSSTLLGNGHGGGKVLSPQLQAQTVPYRGHCGKCGATRVDSQLGMERTPEEYVASLVAIFREVHRVLRKDGSAWLNLGDSYANSGKGGGGAYGPERKGWDKSVAPTRAKELFGLKPKDLVGIPWRVAFALQADGWYLRQDIIWQKKNPMPESTRDRCTKAHEYLFLLSKSPRYYFDNVAIQEPATGKPPGNKKHKGATRYEEGDERHRTAANLCNVGAKTMRNRRSVWSVGTRPYKGAHFAVFPPDLIRPCILAGAPVGGLVLDPFVGSGTTVMVARQEGRIGVGLDLSQDYLANQAKRRIADAVFLARP